MSTDILFVKSVTGEAEAFFSSASINGYNLTTDVPLPSIPVLDSWVTSKGFSTGFFDLDRNSYDRLVEEATDADAIGFYLNYSSHFKVMNAVERIKKHYPNKLVIIGGPSIISLRGDFYKLATSKYFGLVKRKFGSYVDAVVYGEGETALETILKHKDNPDEIGRLIDSDHEDSRGIIYKDTNRNLHVSQKPGIIADLSPLPLPNFSLTEGLLPVAFIETSRGCSFKCPFCEMPGLYSRRRVKNKNQIEAEVNYLQQLGIKHIIITDPAIYPSRRMEMLSEVFTGRDMIWTGYAKPGIWESKEPLYSKEILQKARSSGCISLFFGGESACERTQQMYGKPRLEVIRETERICKEVGLLSCWSFMILNPGETSQDIDRLVDLLVEMDPEMCVFSPFIVMPDSEIDRYPDKYNLRIINPDYKLKAAELYAKFSKNVGVDKKKRLRHLIENHPKLMRFFQKILLSRINYFNCTETDFGLADGAFETLRLESILNRKTNIKVGKSNYHLLFEMAAKQK